jgi:hypothetical protein
MGPANIFGYEPGPNGVGMVEPRWRFSCCLVETRDDMSITMMARGSLNPLLARAWRAPSIGAMSIVAWPLVPDMKNK